MKKFQNQNKDDDVRERIHTGSGAVGGTKLIQQPGGGQHPQNKIGVKGNRNQEHDMQISTPVPGDKRI